jgi:hypothetical protein
MGKNNQLIDLLPKQALSEESFKAEFEAVLLDTIDTVFSGLSETVKASLYNLLEKQYGLKKEAIPANIETFVRALECTFGEAAKLLEIKILHELHSKTQTFRYKPNQKEFFIQYLVALQDHLNCSETEV